jgi:hypothetical protein
MSAAPAQSATDPAAIRDPVDDPGHRGPAVRLGRINSIRDTGGNNLRSACRLIDGQITPADNAEFMADWIYDVATDRPVRLPRERRPTRRHLGVHVHGSAPSPTDADRSVVGPRGGRLSNTR